MPRKPHPADWNRHFGPQARRRRGPLGLLCFTSLAGVMLTVLIIMAQFGLKVRAQQVDQAAVAWATAYVRQTATAVARTATARATPTVQASPTGAARTLGRIGNTSNLRTEPRIVTDNVVGQLVAGDQVEVLNAPDAGAQWLHVRLVQTTGQLKAGSEGWVATALVTLTTPTPTPTPAH